MNQFSPAFEQGQICNHSVPKGLGENLRVVKTILNERAAPGDEIQFLLGMKGAFSGRSRHTC